MNGRLVRRALGVLVTIAALTILEARVVWLVHRSNMPRLVSESHGITDGHPAWATYQSRVLGPFTILFLARTFHWTEERSYHVFGDLMMFAGNLLAFGVGRRLSQHPSAGWILAGTNAAVFTFMQDFWLYPWDFIGALTMMLFAYGIWAGAGISFFVVVFLFELLNRETAIFVALWLVFDGAVRLLRRQSEAPVRLMVGLALVVAGSLWLNFVRDSLLQYQTMPTEGRDMMMGQLVQADVNIDALSRPFSNQGAFQWLCLAAVAAATVQPWRRRSRLAPAMTLLLTMMLASNFLFAVLGEARIWISIAPLMIPLLVPADAHT